MPQALVDGFQAAFVGGAIISAIGIVVALTMIRRDELAEPHAEDRPGRRRLAASARCGLRRRLLLGHEPDDAERRQRQLGRVRLAVPGDALGLDAAEVADVRAAVVAPSRCSAPRASGPARGIPTR